MKLSNLPTRVDAGGDVLHSGLEKSREAPSRPRACTFRHRRLSVLRLLGIGAALVAGGLSGRASQ